MQNNEKDIEIECPICKDEFKKPKLLPCCHTFCQYCIGRYSAERRDGKVQCPLCRTECCVPNGDVTNLPDNRSIKRLTNQLRRMRGVMDIKWSTKLASNVFDDLQDVADFDDSACPKHQIVDPLPVLYVTGMKFYSRRWYTLRVIGGIEVTYSSGLKLLHGGNNYGYEVEWFVLDPDERIIGVSAQSGWMIDGLSFVTNKRSNLGPFGGNGGSRMVLERPSRSAYLVFIKGKVMRSQNARAVRHLQFGWVNNIV